MNQSDSFPGTELTSSSSSRYKLERLAAVFLNPNSGERAAAEFVQHEFSSLLGSDNVFNLFPTPGQPPAIEEAKAFIVRVKPEVLIVAGGDGTVSLAMDIVDSVRADGHIEPTQVPIAVLPMGTGNDLSRSLGFGGGYVKPLLNAKKKFLRKIADMLMHATPIHVDRFHVDMKLLETKESTKGKHKYAPLPTPDDSAGENRDAVISKPFMNYFSVGFDADVAVNFSTFRDENPAACSSRTMNKMWYGCMGCEAMCTSSAFSPQRISLTIDGKAVKVPSDSKAIVVCSMITYAAGNILWHDAKSKYQKPAVNDGLVEVCSLTGPWHLVGIATHTRSAKKLGQGRKVEIVVAAHYSAQYDGEPIQALGKKEETMYICIDHVGQSLGMEIASSKDGVVRPLSSEEEG